MRRHFYRVVFAGAVLVVLGVLWQAFTIAAYIRAASPGWLDAHGLGSLFVHIGQLGIVIGAIVAGRSWRATGAALAFLVLAFAQLAALGNTDARGSWVNGLHGLLALVIMLTALTYAQWSARRLAAGTAETGPREEQSAPVLSPPG